MPLVDLPYTLFIWPVRVIIEFIFILFSRIFYNPALAVIFLSMVVNVLLLPIYTVADRWQHEERTLQTSMKKKLADIRAVFSGDERQMLINTYYRQMGYSPLFALKSSAGFFLQIPFFIAAYQFLSHTQTLAGESLWIIGDMGKPDGLLALGTLQVNVLPILMTIINAASAFVYTRSSSLREKIQLFGIALVFLILLYGSPAALTLYWTLNNVFSLGKNLATAKLKNPGGALQIVSSILALVIIFCVLTGIADVDRYKLLFIGAALLIIAAPFIWKALISFFRRLSFSLSECRILYFSSTLLAFFLLGLLVPSQVIADSVSDFSRPFSFIFRSCVQGFAFCGLVPLLIWAFAAEPVRKILSAIFSVFTLLALISLFALSAYYGVITRTFKIEDTSLIVNAFPFWVNLLALLVSAAVPFFFFVVKKQKALSLVYNAVTAAVFVMVIINSVSIIREDRGHALAAEKISSENAEGKVFPFSSTGTNTFIMFLDRAAGAALYTALEQMPELNDGFDGFTFYPNTLSFGAVTITGLPSLMGGYDYLPLDINKKDNILLKDKLNEALTMLPKLFGEADYRVSVTDPTLLNLQFVPDISVLAGMKNVKARNIDGMMDHRFTEEFPVEDERLN
ncbi:hypothetical protein FACS189498_3490 [Spirochaetia bacterium]|nr:hypothetical protein FACS189498_3490 [Spirochaetia bacterium]